MLFTKKFTRFVQGLRSHKTHMQTARMRENKKRDNSIITNSLVNDFIDYGFLVTGTSNNVLVIG